MGCFTTYVLSTSPGNEASGLPVHWCYLEQVLTEFSVDVKGHCFKFLRDEYTTRFGKDGVSKLDIIHKKEGNPLGQVHWFLFRSSGKKAFVKLSFKTRLLIAVRHLR